MGFLRVSETIIAGSAKLTFIYQAIIFFRDSLKKIIGGRTV